MLDKNPFRFGAVVEGSHYIKRPELEATLKKNLHDIQNVFIVGERRCGKTSLILKVLKEEYQGKFFHADLYGVDSNTELTHRFVRAFAHLQTQFFSFEDTIKSLARFRVKAEVKSDGSGVEFLPTIDAKTSLLDLSAVLEDLRGFSKKHRFAIFVDEFQEIQKLKDHKKIKGEMRSKIQLFQKAPFVYAGSLRHQMDFIFRSPDDPFYKSAVPIEFEKIPLELFYAFVSKNLNQKKIKISKSIFSQIYTDLDGISGDIQQYFRFAFDKMEPGHEIDEAEKNNIYSQVLKSEEKFYLYIMNDSGLTELQRKILVAVAQTGGFEVTSHAFKETIQHSNNNAIVKSLKRLEGQNILFKENKGYRFFNPFFKIWLCST